MQKILISFTSALLLTACAYQIPIQQGNVVTEEQLQRLSAGMDKRQVQFLLGTPLVQDAFHADRWDYYYSFKPGTDAPVEERYRLTLQFDGERLQRYGVHGDIPDEPPLGRYEGAKAK